jgi:ABC-type uncharacterized transport system permease subunit
MHDWGILLLRGALILYSLGLWHSLVTVVKRRQEMFRAALISISVGALLHLGSMVLYGISRQRFPVYTLHEMASLIGFLVTCTFLLVYWRFKYESLAVFVFPTVFLLTLVGNLEGSVDPGVERSLGNWWLVIHVALILLGYAALTLTFVAGVMYLIQEKELKSKRPRVLLPLAAPE